MLLTLYQENLPVEVWGQVSQSPLSGTGLGLTMKLEKICYALELWGTSEHPLPLIQMRGGIFLLSVVWRSRDVVFLIW